MNSAHLYLIRHGETEWSRTGQHTSRTDLALTPVGLEQSRRLSGYLASIPFKHVLTSPRLRARQTCELAGLAEKALVEPLLREWEYGEYEGLRTVEIQALQPGWNIFTDGCPRGESPAEIQARVDEITDRLRSLEGPVAVFAHGHFLRVFGVRWIGLPVTLAQRLQLSTASVCVLTGDRAIHSWNQTASESWVAH